MSEYEQIQGALRKCEEKFSKAFRDSPLVLTLTSAEDHRYIDVNETFERVTGWNREQIIGRTPFDIGIWVEPTQRIDFVRRLLAGETIRNLEVRARTKNGEVRTGSGSGELIEINGETCVLSLIADITDLKQAEEAKQIAEHLSSMSRRLIQAHEEERKSIAGELREHVERLLLLSVELDRFGQNASESVGELSQGIGAARQQIEDVVKDIQSLSQRLHAWKVEFLGIEAAAAAFCKELSHQKNLEIDFASANFPKELPKEVSLCLLHVLRDALQNVTEHSGSRKIQVSLRVESDQIHLTVRDSGIGFDPEKAAEGPGLGLAIMRERMRVLGGELSIESQYKRGTTIHAYVPLHSGRTRH